jgi:hypothetical protein
MQTCSNCSEPFDDAKDGLVLTGRGRTVATVCGGCCADVRVGKIVVRRLDVGRFAYEQWLPTEVVGGAAG